MMQPHSSLLSKCDNTNVTNAINKNKFESHIIHIRYDKLKSVLLASINFGAALKLQVSVGQSLIA